MEPKVEIVSKARRQFIKRERIRRALQHAKPGGIISLQSDEVETLLAWLKELEERTRRK